MLVSLDTNLDMSGKRECQQRNYLHQIGLWGIFLTNDGYVRAKLTVKVA